ncbi:MAG: hypothetical protein O3A00_06715, partial [Planctomycetota bacterium]|nr:hypothetical protein [Planctomycetota bacterium]
MVFPRHGTTGLLQNQTGSISVSTNITSKSPSPATRRERFVVTLVNPCVTMIESQPRMQSPTALKRSEKAGQA